MEKPPDQLCNLNVLEPGIRNVSFLSDVNEKHLEYVSGTFGDQRRFGRRANAIIQRKTVNPEIIIC